MVPPALKRPPPKLPEDADEDTKKLVADFEAKLSTVTLERTTSKKEEEPKTGGAPTKTKRAKLQEELDPLEELLERRK